MEEMYRILFAHPQVEAITGWDFADGAWLNAPSGVIRKDNSVKPAYTMLKNLIKGEWWTKQEIMTDEQGYALVDGFKGEYKAVYQGKEVPFFLDDNMPETQLTL